VRYLSSSLSLILLSLALGACGEPEPGDITPSLSNIQRRIFTPSCSFRSCHGASEPQKDLSLSAGLAYGALVNMDSVTHPGLKRVVPGDPLNSVLFLAVQGTTPGIKPMPEKNPALPAYKLEMIRQWIEAGALDD
jgi:hypothetical protein